MLSLLSNTRLFVVPLLFHTQLWPVILWFRAIIIRFIILTLSRHGAYRSSIWTPFPFWSQVTINDRSYINFICYSYDGNCHTDRYCRNGVYNTLPLYIVVKIMTLYWYSSSAVVLYWCYVVLCYFHTVIFTLCVQHNDGAVV